LGESYSADSDYSISLALGDAKSSGEEGKKKEGGEGGTGSIGASYTVNLYAGDTLIGTRSGSTGDIDALSDITFSSTTKDASLNGQALSLEIVKTGGEELEIDNVRGTVFTEGSSNTGNDGRWTLSYTNANGGQSTRTYSASGENWSFQDLIDQVNGDTALTGWSAQMAEINTTRAFTYNPDSTDDRTLTLGTGSEAGTEITIAAGSSIDDAVAQINEQADATGVTAVREGSAIRFLSLADSVTVAFNADPSSDSTQPLFRADDSTVGPNGAFSETYRKGVNFYRSGDFGGAGVVSFRAPDGSSISSTMETVLLREGEGPEDPEDPEDPEGPGEATNPEEAVTLLNKSGANFVLAVVDEFIEDLNERVSYYGSVEVSLETALKTANLTEDQALRSEERIDGIDRLEVTAKALVASLLEDSSIAVLSQSNAQRGYAYELLMKQPRGNAYGFYR
jgi:flagellin-like hook-associated protein FlgL